MVRKFAWALMLLMGISLVAQAESEMVFKKSTTQPYEDVYEMLKTQLEEARYWVIFEANMGKSLAYNAERWGDDYNKSKLDEIRSIVFCNPWYANQVSNLDPDALSFCPLSVTVIAKQGVTSVLFERPSIVAKGSPAEDLMWEVENDVINVIQTVLTPSN